MHDYENYFHLGRVSKIQLLCELKNSIDNLGIKLIGRKDFIIVIAERLNLILILLIVHKVNKIIHMSLFIYFLHYKQFLVLPKY